MGWTRLLPDAAKRWLRRLVRMAGLRLERARPPVQFGDDRYSYQRRHVAFGIRPGDRVLDVGCGGHPFPPATVLVDRYPGRTAHRYEPMVTGGRPLVVADVHQLPFADDAFDFVYCSHVLEHVDDPLRACWELMRVGLRGYVETPTLAKDMLFARTEHTHRWHVVAIAHELVFFECSVRQARGIGSGAWTHVIEGPQYHALQEAYAENQDLFNCMFPWEGHFRVSVFRLDGTVDALVQRRDKRLSHVA